MSSISFHYFEHDIKRRIEKLHAVAIDSRPHELTEGLLHDVFVFPVNFLAPGTQPAFQCGVYNQSGLLDDSTVLYRGTKRLSSLPHSVDITKFASEFQIVEKAVYGGFLTRHYGHILTESIARLWAVSKYSHLPVLFCGAHKKVPLVSLLANIYSHSGAIEFLLPTCPIRIKRLVVPTPTMINRRYVHPEHALPLRRSAQIILQTGSRRRLTYLSRSRLASDSRKITNELAIESMIESLGGHVYHPQEHELYKQIAVVCNSEVVVSSIGSAVHTLLFSTSIQKIIYVCADWINPNFPMIDEILNVDASYVSCLERRREKLPSERPFTSTCNVSLLREAIIAALAR